MAYNQLSAISAVETTIIIGKVRDPWASVKETGDFHCWCLLKIQTGESSSGQDPEPRKAPGTEFLYSIYSPPAKFSDELGTDYPFKEDKKEHDVLRK